MILSGVFLSLIFWSWHTDFKRFTKDYQEGIYKEATAFAEEISTPQTHFCAIGDYTASYFQYYTSRPIAMFDTVDAFQAWGEKAGNIVCFISTTQAINEEEKKILYILLKYYSFKKFGDTFIFFPKDQ